MGVKMGVCRNIETLAPVMQLRVKRFLAECKRQGIKVEVIETVRSEDVQKAYFAQGRESLEVVNELRKKAGLYLLSESENKKTITNCDGVKNKSNHQKRADGWGYAIDIAPVNNSGSIWWNAPEQVWQEIGLLAESFGLDWCAGGYGATWGKGWDNPHFELME